MCGAQTWGAITLGRSNRIPSVSVCWFPVNSGSYVVVFACYQAI